MSEKMKHEPAESAAAPAAEDHDHHDDHHDDHGPTDFQEEGLNVRALGVVVLLTIVFIVVSVASAYTLAVTTSQEYKMDAMAAAIYPELRETQAAQASKINQYKVINEEDGIYQIPIEQAMSVLLNEAYLDEEERALTSELLIQKP